MGPTQSFSLEKNMNKTKTKKDLSERVSVYRILFSGTLCSQAWTIQKELKQGEGDCTEWWGPYRKCPLSHRLKQGHNTHDFVSMLNRPVIVLSSLSADIYIYDYISISQ